MKLNDVVLRLFLAVLIGGMVGYEREFKHRPAGFRTHMLVCIGAAIISMIQVQMVDEIISFIENNGSMSNILNTDYGRLGAQVISGIGFLGAGTIIHEKGSIKGLTTAASLWVVACVGLAIGLGYYILSVLSGISVVLVLVSMKKLEDRIVRNKSIKLEIDYRSEKSTLQYFEEYFNQNNIKIKKIEFILSEDEENLRNVCIYTILLPKQIKANDVMYYLISNKDVIKITEIEN
ncbi:methyltransferase [Clostridium polyendosporum]|uniref:Methyltransferase n=1 Tax=Clostridium polyendosporum TaxID=69208 RepID=A0A919S228_9CLOT|nr:MgtC/SapB family protein [Clostridium polyendosporum]GIM30687.1 methyltransferase [Clostridium polyendosporum]